MPMDAEPQSVGCNDYEALLRQQSPPLVSVIVRSSGAAARSVLDSIDRQSYPAIEIILAGAAGQEPQAEAGCRERFPVRAVGAGEAVSGGDSVAEALEVARGEYVAVVDGGVWWLPHAVASLVVVLERRSAAVAAYGATRMVEGGDRALAPAGAVLSTAPGGPIPLGAALFRRRLLDEGCRPADASETIEEWDFWLRALQLGPVLRTRQITHIRTGAATCSGGGAVDPMAERRRWRARLMTGCREAAGAAGGALAGASLAAALAETASDLDEDVQRARARLDELKGLLAPLTDSRSWRLATALGGLVGRLCGRRVRKGGQGTGGASGQRSRGKWAGDGATPLVSVILPVFNARGSDGGFLREAVASVCSQTYRNLELIIVDDGSTDGTLDLCCEIIARRDEVPIRLYHKPNGGQSSARNAGVVVSRGEWLCFIDQDDVWYPDRLEAVLGSLSSDVDLVYSDADTIDESGWLVVLGIHRFLGAGGRHPKRRIEEILFDDVFVVPGVMTVRRTTFDEVGGFDEALSGYEDDDLFLRLFESATIEYVPRSTLRWRQHGESASRSTRMVDSRLRYWRKLMANHTDGGRDRARIRRISLRFAREMLRQANWSYCKGGAIHHENVATAQELLRYVGPRSRTVFAVFIANGLRWRRPNRLLELFWDRWLRLA